MQNIITYEDTNQTAAFLKSYLSFNSCLEKTQNLLSADMYKR